MGPQTVPDLRNRTDQIAKVADLTVDPMRARAMLARLERCWREWPPRLAAEARNYSVSGRAWSRRSQRLLDTQLSYSWPPLPEWLAVSKV